MNILVVQCIWFNGFLIVAISLLKYCHPYANIFSVSLNVNITAEEYQSRELRQGFVSIVNGSECEKLDHAYFDFKDDRMICTADLKSGSSAPCYVCECFVQNHSRKRNIRPISYRVTTGRCCAFGTMFGFNMELSHP